MLKNSKIVGESMYLRELTQNDATTEYCSWLNDPEVNKYLATKSATTQGLREYIQKQIDDTNCLFYGIFNKENDLHVGNLKLEPIDWQKKSAVVGILIGNKAYWGKGIGTEALKLIVDFAFYSLNFNEVTLGVIGEHSRAIRAYEKVGFRVTEVKEKSVNYDGVLYDHVFMAINNKLKIKK